MQELGSATRQYDAIIVGAGHNGLVCGNYLARAGLKVCILERRHIIGGASVTEDLWGGYKVSTAAHMMGLLQPKIILDLELQKFGFEVLPTTPTVQYIENAGPVVLWRDVKRLCEQFARFSARDAASYPAYVAHLQKLGAMFRRLMWEIPFDPGSFRTPDLLRTAGFLWRNRGMAGSFRDVSDIMTMSAYDYLSHRFESDAVRTILGYYPAAGAGQSVSIHTKGTAFFLLRGYLRDNETPAGGTGLVRGGMGAIADALAKSGARFGMDIRVDAEVSRILVKDGRTEGIVLKNGDQIRAPLVISNASARRTFLEFVENDALPDDFVRDIRGFKGQSTAFKVHLAVSELPHYAGVAPPGSGEAYPTQVTIAPSVAYLEQAYRDTMGGRLSRHPYLTVLAPTAIDPDLAPDGHHQLSIYGGHIPAGDDAENNGVTKAAILKTVIETLSIYAPRLPDSVLHSHVMIPSDYETVFGLPGGNPHHADLTLDQMFFRRPAPGYADYRSPIRGLYLCSASTHPGGGVTGIPGYNAARMVLKTTRRPASAH